MTLCILLISALALGLFVEWQREREFRREIERASQAKIEAQMREERKRRYDEEDRRALYAPLDAQAQAIMEQMRLSEVADRTAGGFKYEDPALEGERAANEYLKRNGLAE